jgi:hypothetical protein
MIHRCILGITDPEIEVDHRDNNGLNNVRSNLRTCTHQENMRFRFPDRDWAALDAKRSLAREYREERAVSKAIQDAHRMSRQNMWRIRFDRFQRIKSAAALEYRGLTLERGIRQAWQFPRLARGGKFGVMK